MHSQTNLTVPRHMIEALESSVADIAAGKLADAAAVQAEALNMLNAHDRQRPTPPGSSAAKRPNAD